jgi:hypothetical protein
VIAGCVTAGGQRQITYSGFGEDIHDIYVVMVNTSLQTDDYEVRVGINIIA